MPNISFNPLRKKLENVKEIGTNLFLDVFNGETFRKIRDSISDSSLPSGLTFYKDFSANRSSINADTSSGSSTGTLTTSRGTSNPASYIFKQTTQSLLFDGQNDSVTLATLGTYITNDFTIIVKMDNPTVNGNEDFIFSCSDAGAQRFYIRFVNGNNDFLIGLSSWNEVLTKSNTTGPISIALSLSGTTGKFYVNGVFIGEETGLTVSLPTSTQIKLGRNQNNTQFYSGEINNFKIYDRALSDAEITSEYGGTSITTNLVSHYDFSDGAGTTLTDIVSANNGQIVGAQWLIPDSYYIKYNYLSNIARFTEGFYDSSGISLTPGLYLETQSTNYLTRSNQFDHTDWVKTNITITANTTRSPDGSDGADTLASTSANGTILQTKTWTSRGNTFSIFLKRKTGSGIIQITLDGGSTWETVVLTSEWLRFNKTQTNANPSVGIRIVTSGDEIYAWGSQLEQMLYPSSYIPTISSIVTRNSEVLSYSLSANFPAPIGTDHSATLLIGLIPSMLSDEQPSDNREIMSIEINSDNKWAIRYGTNAQDRIEFLSASAGTDLLAYSSPDPFSSTRYGFHSIIATFRNANSTKLSIDGDTFTQSPSPYVIPSGSLPSTIDIVPSNLQGLILTHLGIWNKALSQSEVTSVDNIID